MDKAAVPLDLSLNHIPKAPPGSHEALPARDTWHAEDGGPADLLTGPYPVIAECSACGGRIRLEYRLQAEWRHVR
jgi:hypothetical protein